MSLPLSGVVVLDFSTLLPGPLATLMLAEAGADVIKVERPGHGDEMRTYEPRVGSQSVNFALLNRGKRSVALDLKSDADRARLTGLLQRADVIVEQFRPGVMDRLGLGYEAVSAVNPRIVYCSITGYGQSGPKRDVAGHDLNYQGDAGMLALSHGDPRRPSLPPALVADVAGGSYPAVLNILLALRTRERDGIGCHLDIAMADNLFPFLYWSLGQGAATGAWPGNGDALVTGGTPRYRLYPTADGRLVAAAPIEDRFWSKFCDAVGLSQDATTDAVGAAIAAEPAAHWREVFARADCCCSIVATPAEAASDPHFAARGLFDWNVTSGNEDLPALPMPIVRGFRASPGVTASPELGEADADLAR